MPGLKVSQNLSLGGLAKNLHIQLRLRNQTLHTYALLLNLLKALGLIRHYSALLFALMEVFHLRHAKDPAHRNHNGFLA